MDFPLTVATEDPIYIFFKTENQKSVNLWLGQWNDETSDYDFDWFNAYFEGDNYTIMRLGQFDIGTKLCLRMTVANEYTIVKNFFFYSFDALRKYLRGNYEYLCYFFKERLPPISAATFSQFL